MASMTEEIGVTGRCLRCIDEAAVTGKCFSDSGSSSNRKVLQ